MEVESEQTGGLVTKRHKWNPGWDNTAAVLRVWSGESRSHTVSRSRVTQKKGLGCASARANTRARVTVTQAWVGLR